MHITGTHFNYYFVCKRKLWLFANGINMEHTSDLVYEGKLIHETSYPQRSERYEELEIAGCKIDFYDANNKVVHEIKKSDKIEVDRVIFKVLNKKELQEKHFDKKLNKCVLNKNGKMIFVKAFEERLNETIQHRSLKRKVSYRHLIKLECYKLSKHLLSMEEYKPFKMWW